MRRAERAASALQKAGGRQNKLAATKRQTLDVGRMLLAFAPLTTAHLVLMEDDWLLCEGGMHAIRYLLRKASLYLPPRHARGGAGGAGGVSSGVAGWAALRFSYGLNGILLHARDAKPLATFFLNPASEPENDLPDAPVDHLAYRFLRGKYAHARAYLGGRRIVAFRHTLFWHVGDASAVGNANTRHKPKCYGLTKEWLFEQESFHADECPDDDLWPCDGRPPATSERGVALAALARQAETEAGGGASRCSGARVCWRRPEEERINRFDPHGAAAVAAAKCARVLRCDSAGGPAGALRTPCVQQSPEYSM